MSQTDDPSTPTIVVIGFIGAILTFAIIVALQALYYHANEREVAAKSAGYVPAQLTQQRSAQQADLATYGWVDQANGVARIPIDRAMDLTVGELQAGGAGRDRESARGS